MDNNNVRAAINKRLKKQLNQEPFSFGAVIDPITNAIEQMQDNIVSNLKHLEDQVWAIASYEAAKKGKLINCRGCGEEFSLTELFRCYHCGSYFCRKCAREHFGARASERIKGAA